MLSAQKGFTLLEMLIAMALSSVLLLGTSRLFPALQLEVLRQYGYVAQQEALWQMAFAIGKNLQRAGYCRGQCQGEGVKLTNQGGCVVVQWDANHNGRWDTAKDSQNEQTGYRLRNGNLETQKGVEHCEGSGWERMSDPAQSTVQHFSVTRQNRKTGRPLFLIKLASSLKQGGRAAEVNYVVSGENL
ncbi:prepilin peptidase-dependent protein [Cedecea sp. P7760]|jgi:prepilin peptidase dependent protein B|uniref:prepilin peptidase-dependent protein n=1 Tax=Cedecea sp. P7760 TaxID=2726983 RepID=UPI00159FD818|nr:prepilin peptidase-dependent protein [Cedecea sp. P7760]NWC61734.1 prepilin peptidase-dependent protein [Cedecea sp. P7760]